MNEDRLYAILCGVVGLALAAIVVLFTVSVHGWKFSALVRMDPLDAMAPTAQRLDPDFAFVANGHYDGVYAYTIAIDPFARRAEHWLIDYASYRYGRAGYGWAARAFSFGRADWIPGSLALVNIFGLAFGAYLASRLATRFGLPALSGLAVSLHPGLLVGASLDTSEPFSVALVAGALLAWFSRRFVLAILLMAFLCLVKEMFLALPLGLALWEVVHARRTKIAIPKRHVMLLLSSIVPVVGWWIYLRTVFDEWPFDQPWLVSLPGLGWLDTMWSASLSAGKGGLDAQFGIPAISLVLAVGTALLIAAVRAVRVRTPFDGIFLFFFFVSSVLSWWQLLFGKEFLRILSIPLLFMFLSFASKRMRLPKVVDANDR